MHRPLWLSALGALACAGTQATDPDLRTPPPTQATPTGEDTDTDTDTTPCDGVWPGLPADGVTLPGSSPEGVRLGPDCALYVTEGDTVYRIAPDTPDTATAFATDAAATDLQGLDFGADGHLYVASRGANAVVRFDGATGAYLDVFATADLDGPNTPRFGPDGRLYVSGCGSLRVT